MATPEDVVLRRDAESGQSSTVVMVLVLEEVGEPYLPMGGKNWKWGLPIPEDIT